jgi:16S rRNA (cytosine967-C5)-methyltransferase
LIGIFLSENVSNEHLQLHKPEWDSNIHLSLDSKIILTGYSFSVTDIFPFKDELSRQIPHKRFSVSHLIQPLLFLRLRKKTRHMLMAKIEKACWQYSMPDQDCIALPNGTRTDEIIRIDDEAVIQDYNSQQVFNFLKKESVQESLDKFRKYHLQFRHVKILKAWDCCAASGGKTILLYDLLHHSLKPTVSDIRFSILLNLHKRFKKANIRYYDYFIGDFEKKIFPEAADSPFPIIICDAPCTGSGTWSRTPEQLYYFKKETIQVYSERQKRIVHNVLPFLAAGGLFFYITCSAFKQENEEIAAFIQNKPGYKQVFTELLKGWDKRADTMFVAVFRREF